MEKYACTLFFQFISFNQRFQHNTGITRRERLKSAPYLRLKKRKKLFLKKKLKIFFSKFYRIFFSKNQKNGLSGAPGPASASPWRAKRGTLLKLSTFLLQLKEEPFGEKTNFRKKSHNAEKLKGGTLWDF